MNNLQYFCHIIVSRMHKLLLNMYKQFHGNRTLLEKCGFEKNTFTLDRSGPARLKPLHQTVDDFCNLTDFNSKV